MYVRARAEQQNAGRFKLLSSFCAAFWLRSVFLTPDCECWFLVDRRAMLRSIQKYGSSKLPVFPSSFFSTLSFLLSTEQVGSIGTSSELYLIGTGFESARTQNVLTSF